MDYPGKVIRKTAVTPSQTSASGVWTVDDALQAVKNNTWPIAGVPNPISRSLRFNSADTAYLNRTPATVGNRQKFTISFWVKRSTVGAADVFTGNSANANGFLLTFQSESVGSLSQTVNLYNDGAAPGGWQIFSARVIRDVGAWYHFVIALDTTQATDSNRIKVYINGIQEDIATWQVGSGASRYPSLNANIDWNNTTQHRIGHASSLGYFNGYITEFYNIDGQQLAASDFGLTDPQTGQWVPKKYTGTYGTNGFYLNFSDNSSTGTLGYDYSGNSNNWTSNNFSVTAGAGNDSLVDVPTPWIAYNTSGDTGGIWRGNYCTLNPLNQTGASLTNGNLQFTKSGGAGASLYTIHPTLLVSSGKWYFEVTPTAINTNGSLVGIVGSDVALATYSSLSSMTGNIWAYRADAYKVNNGSSASYGNTWTTNDVIGVAVDMDNGKIWWSKNGTWQASGDPAAGTNAAYTNVSGSVGPLLIDQGISGTFDGSINAGQRPFAYAPPAGFLSLCTTNLPTPTIGATSTTQAGKYFNTVLYTGNGSTQTISGVGFQPDLVWAKSRSNAYYHTLIDAVRGRAYILCSNRTDADAGPEPSDKELTAFTSDGFSLGPDYNLSINTNTATFVAWNWKANGAGSSNTAGSITSTVSANTAAGFSVVTYTGNGTSGATVGHGCLVNGVATVPSMVILKRRDAVSNWQVKHVSLNANQNLELNSTAAVDTAPGSGYISAISSTTLTLLNGGSAITNVNANTGTYVVYCFASVAGYSAFGSYTGNGSSDGTFVYTGFRPAFVLFKQSSASGIDWMIFDNKRSPYNATQARLFPSLSNAEVDGAPCDFLSNGFKMRENNSYNNTSGATYIYAAFAEFPFKFSNAR